MSSMADDNGRWFDDQTLEVVKEEAVIRAQFQKGRSSVSRRFSFKF